MKLIVITTPRFYPGEGLILTRLFQEGMQRLHIRKPECSKEELCTLMEDIPPVYYSRIVLHDCFEIASALNTGGIHLNSRNRQIPDGFAGSISRSCHSLQEVQDSSSCNYVFLSPIFPSISKEGYGSGFSMETLKEASVCGIINEKVIALGGMDQQTIPLMKSLNFGGVAVLGALWGKEPAVKETNNIVKQHDKLLQLWNNS